MPAGQSETEARAHLPDSTFVIRFWWEWSAAEPQWRGRIDHIQSGESGAFLDTDGMIAFMQRFGALTADGGRPPGASV